MSVLAKRYGEGLFSLAVEKDKVAEYREQIDFVKITFDESNVLPFIKSYKVSKEEKKDLVKNAFDKHVDQYVLNFLFLLIDKDRMVYYDDIFDEFHKLCNEQLKIKEGIIETARELDEESIKKLEKALSDGEYTVVLKPKINKDLISGFRVTIEEKVIDNTMKQRIKQMEEILKRKDGVYGA